MAKFRYDIKCRIMVFQWKSTDISWAGSKNLWPDATVILPNIRSPRKNLKIPYVKPDKRTFNSHPRLFPRWNFPSSGTIIYLRPHTCACSRYHINRKLFQTVTMICKTIFEGQNRKEPGSLLSINRYSVRNVHAFLRLFQRGCCWRADWLLS